MNLLLLEAGEVGPDGVAVLRGRRARHLQEVLQSRPGHLVRAGVVDGGIGTAEVLGSTADAITLRCRFEQPAPPAGTDTLLLAVPRPKVLRRCAEDAAALGFARLILFRAWHTDRSHLLAEAMTPACLRAHLLLGMELSARTRLPEVLVEPLFKPFVEDRLDALLAGHQRWLAHPGPDAGPPPPAGAGRPVALALGPERGFTPYEIEALRARGFAVVTAGPHPLRVHTALCVLGGQLLLRQAPRRDQ